MSFIGRMTFHHGVSLDDGVGYREPINLDIEVSCELHCDNSDDGPYAECFSIRVGSWEWDEGLVDDAVERFDLEMLAIENLYGLAPTAHEFAPGVYTRIGEDGYRQRVEVLGTAKAHGECEWYVITRRLMPFGRDTSLGLISVSEFRMPSRQPRDEDYETETDPREVRTWRRVENMPRELKVGMRVMVMERPARVIKLSEYGGLQQATIEWDEGQEPLTSGDKPVRTMLLGPQQLADPDIITMLGEVLLDDDAVEPPPDRFGGY